MISSAAADVGVAVADAFAGVLRIAQVPPDASFFELGGSSLMAAQMLYDLRSLSGTDDRLVPPPVWLVDFAAWQRTRYADGGLEREFDSWRARVADAPVPKLPFIIPNEAPIVAGVLNRTVPAETAARLAQVAGATATTMPMMVLAAFMVALHRAGGQARLSVPTSAAGRDRPELDRA